MDSRRDFLKKAALLSSAAGLAGLLPASIQKAFAIDPEAGTTFLDAEHVVILMQENRSFDHTYGTLQGVRGFNDPRAMEQPNHKKVWFQTNAKGETYAPFRLNIKDTKATWMSSLPHSWENQVDAFHGGRMDGWLEAKKSGHKDYADMPLTLGYYNREDLPFYYALADAFTVCDQNFCSSLTGTTPNRLYLWTGTLRDPRNPKAQANVRNENVDYEDEVSWKTFPERLEDEGISWKVYQNEISLSTGLEGEEDSWLANFTDNPLEWFSQFRVRFHPAYRTYIQKQVTVLPEKIKTLEESLRKLATSDPSYEKTKRTLNSYKKRLQTFQSDLKNYTPEAFAKLSAKEKNLHQRAYTTNVNDPDYHQLTTLSYEEAGQRRSVRVPKGDVLHQFRSDVKNKTLPTVSWVVAPENFSDHPSAPWYGAWYLSEMLDILTQDPEVWKKTIFILAYDENDGYFDHVPPFIPAHPDQPESGRTSAGIDTRLEFVTAEQEASRKEHGRTGPIGLGFRVPLVIASPWSRGGYVCSEVFDHTSVVQFLEKFVSHKRGKTLRETNISDWRRTVCGDLTSAFRPYAGEKMTLPTFVSRDPFVQSIHQAQFKPLPTGYKALSTEDLRQPATVLPQQEKGIRPSCALPYELYADVVPSKQGLQLVLSAKNELKGSTGAPFQVHEQSEGALKIRSYTVAAGDTLRDSFPTTAQLKIYGPNGFYREFSGGTIQVSCDYQRNRQKQYTGQLVLRIQNLNPTQDCPVSITDESYGNQAISKTLARAGQPGDRTELVIDLQKSHQWYDLSVKGSDSVYRYAGRVETGKAGYTDPLLG
ncbi:phosphocholine-specific phospholipase C [Siphonobacter curvatus]|uniref:phospholipase C n=1 Tax=Siphonobacter curvatus TaxID=2094562 RepID=A0A2S7II48_9BACT|nr:phospholipase C, phosphocholine-specific [Siphonobacter curvatus]PQA55636.1 phospholipase C, phosphocholine-specific [Siphonobacter curvatus]